MLGNRQIDLDIHMKQKQSYGMSNIVWLAQFSVFHFENSYFLVDVHGLTIIFHQSNLHYNNSYKTFIVITNIIIH